MLLEVVFAFAFGAFILNEFIIPPFALGAFAFDPKFKNPAFGAGDRKEFIYR
jgi:hypothetical protein